MINEKFSKSMLRRNKGIPMQINLPRKVQNRIIELYIKTKTNYASTLAKNFRNFETNKLSFDDYLNKQKSIMKNAFTEAFTLGKFFATGQYKTLSDDERRFIVYQVTKEMDFMEQFAKDVHAKTGKMPYLRRLQMYSDSLDALFGFGRLAYLPDDVTIIWKLGNTDKHCIDCLAFAANNPYTKKTLPGIPKSGNSRCLSNCRCSLLYYYANTNINSEYEQMIFSSNQYSKNKNIPSEDEFFYLKNLQDEYYYNQMMFEIKKDRKYKNNAINLKQQFFDFKTKNNLYYPLEFTNRKMLYEVKQFVKNKKFMLIEDANLITEGDFVSAFIGNQQMYAKVIQQIRGEILIQTLEGLQYVLSVNKNIIFKEIV